MNSNSRHYYWRKILGQNQALYAFKSITYFSAEFKCNLSFGHLEAHARSTSNQFVADLMRTIDSYLNSTLRSDEEGVGLCGPARLERHWSGSGCSWRRLLHPHCASVYKSDSRNLYLHPTWVANGISDKHVFSKRKWGKNKIRFLYRGWFLDRIRRQPIKSFSAMWLVDVDVAIAWNC